MSIEERFRRAVDEEQLELFPKEKKRSRWVLAVCIVIVLIICAVVLLI